MEEFSDGALGAAGCFPKELMKFFETGPRLLLVKGKSKVGKTVFMLTLAEALGPPMNLFIVNTREPEPRNYEAFQWLSTNEARDKALESLPSHEMRTKKDAETSQATDTGAKLKSARDLLKSILGEDPVLHPPEPERKSAPQLVSSSGPAELSSLRNALGNKNPRELLRVYRGLEGVGSARAVVGVNRIDRLGEKYDIPLRPLALALKADIVTGRNAHLVMVLEKPTDTVDDISDGVVSLKDVSHGDEFLGQLEVGKLADMALRQNRWMYNTLTGKFQVLKGISTL
jgi:hypothetical protein